MEGNVCIEGFADYFTVRLTLLKYIVKLDVKVSAGMVRGMKSRPLCFVVVTHASD